MISKRGIGILLLKLAVAFPLIYAATDGFIHPDQWIGFLPVWLPEILPRESVLTLFSIFELILGLWVLFARESVHVAGIVATVFYGGVTVVNLGSFLVVFRDIGLALAAAGLSFMSLEPEEEEWDEDDEYEY